MYSYSRIKKMGMSVVQPVINWYRRMKRFKLKWGSVLKCKCSSNIAIFSAWARS